MKSECPNGHQTPPELQEAGKVIRCPFVKDGITCDAVYTVTPSKESPKESPSKSSSRSVGRPRKVS